MYRDTCVIYNKYIDTAMKDTLYLRTVLHNVQWQSSKGRNVMRSGASSIDALTVYIRPRCSIKKYLTSADFAKIPTANISDFWTISAGDILVQGEPDYEYVQGDNPLSVLKQDYSEAFSVTSIDYWLVGDEEMNHFEVWGK